MGSGFGGHNMRFWFWVFITSPNIGIDKQRNADLDKLTLMGGPFTKPELVEEYMIRDDVKEEEKGKRLYPEIRHAKNSTVSFPKVSEIFRVKKNHKNCPIGCMLTTL